MVQETGVIERIEGNYAYVKAEKTGSCGSCASQCMSADGKDYVIVHTINDVGAKEGDTVKFEVPVGSFLKASIIIYVIPMIALIIGSLVGKGVHPHFSDSITKDGLSAVTAFIFLLLSIILVKFIGKNTENERYIPKIVQIIN